MAEISTVGRIDEVEVACGARRHAIDGSGRFARPQAFIDALGNSFYITVDNRNNLVMFPVGRFRELALCWRKMRSRQTMIDDATVRAIQRTVFLAEPIKADSNNRVQIPDNLKTIAKPIPKDSVCIVGDLDRIVLWDNDTYQDYLKQELCNDLVTKRQGELLYLTAETFNEDPTKERDAQRGNES